MIEYINGYLEGSPFLSGLGAGLKGETCYLKSHSSPIVAPIPNVT